MRLIQILLLLIPLSANSANNAAYFKAEAFTYSAPVPYSEFMSDWSSGFQGGNTALAYSWLEVGVSLGQWGVATTRQQYAQMYFSDDTAELYYLTENKLPIKTPHSYYIDLQMNGFSSSGLRLFHRSKPISGLSLEVGVNYLEGGELLSGRIHGQVSSSSDRDYDFDNVQIDYHYHEDKLFDRQVSAPSGNGLALDLQGKWQITSDDLLSLELRNLFGYIKWKSSPYTTAQIHSDNKSYDENGYVIVQPTLSGWHLNKDYRQSLPLLWQLGGDHQLSQKMRLSAQIMGSEVQKFYRIGGSYQLYNQQWLKLLYAVNTGSLAIDYQGQSLQLQLQFDPSSLGESHTLSLALGLTHSF